MLSSALHLCHLRGLNILLWSVCVLFFTRQQSPHHNSSHMTPYVSLLLPTLQPLYRLVLSCSTTHKPCLIVYSSADHTPFVVQYSILAFKSWLNILVILDNPGRLGASRVIRAIIHKTGQIYEE